jgi:DnaK suppressor protein
MTTQRSNLSSSDVERLRRALVEKRDALNAAQRASRPQQAAIGELESEDGDIAEQIIEQDGALRLAAFDASLLSEVEHALSKIDAGNYGLSEDSGEPIPLERLQVVPWARRTVQEEERRR